MLMGRVHLRALHVPPTTALIVDRTPRLHFKHQANAAKTTRSILLLLLLLQLFLKCAPLCLASLLHSIQLRREKRVATTTAGFLFRLAVPVQIVDR